MSSIRKQMEDRAKENKRRIIEALAKAARRESK